MQLNQREYNISL